ncbi:MAG: guanylate kinase [Gammaproteobacteria bacterium]
MASSDASGPAGRLIVISAPSGAGKTSLVRALLNTDRKARFSTSYTTRPPRTGEQNGTDYIFVAPSAFETMADNGEFLEHATVFDHSYGTSATQVDELTRAGHDVLLEIDWQGAAQVRAKRPDCLSIFILPPSLEELERRLRGRSTDSPQVIQRRLDDALDDMSHWGEFNFVVVNEDFDEALDDLRSVLNGTGDRFSTIDKDVRLRIAKVLA